MTHDPLKSHFPHTTLHLQNETLLEGNETGGVSGTDTGPTVLDGLAVVVVRKCRILRPQTDRSWPTGTRPVPRFKK